MQQAMSNALLCVVFGTLPGLFLTVETSASNNPVRKVVTMLQIMQRKVMQEGEKEKELHDKFVCYCNTYSNVELRKAVAADKAKIEELTSAVAAAQGQLEQLQEDLKKHTAEAASAETAIKDATALREKEAAAFAASSAEDKKNIAALKKAEAAIKKGTSTEFIQTSVAQSLQKIVVDKQDMSDPDRRDMLAFLQGKDEAPSSDVILGIMSTMLEEMTKALADATAAEETAIAEHEQLLASKQKELKSLQAAIEKKSAREGELGVKLVDMKNDLSDTKTSLEENEKLLTDLDKMCDAKEAEYENNKKLRAEELAALADTIKILNDDDALELFKKALPGSSSFLQVKVNSAMLKARALQTIQKVMTKTEHRPKIDFITLALKGKKISFDKILKMIDDMVATLKTEQLDDESKKKYCESEFDTTDDKKKSLENSMADEETAMDDAKESITAVKEEIKALQDGIKDLDKSVADQTEQRKEEHEEFTECMASDTAAKEVLAFAKNRLNKFYNPSLYVPPPKEELSEQDQMAKAISGDASSFLQLTSDDADAPPPPPAAVSAFKSKSKESTGVIEMIDLLVADLDKEMTQHEAEEKEGQSDYEAAMKDSAEKRKADTQSIEEKESALADLEGELDEHGKEHLSIKKEYAATLQYIHGLQSECGFLLKYFGVRKEARTEEIQALEKAKQILNGADLSLAQTEIRRHLRKSH
jgi:septal ring factor EnvC (AmiA/AmiB activator)/bacterioferritin-associated ferredoxin